jgi:hypothetical protein
MHQRTATDYIVAVNLFEWTIFMDPGRERGPSECDADFIGGITAPVNNYMKGVPNEFRGIFRFYYSEYVRFNSVVPGLVQLHHLASEDQTGPVLMCYTLARYRQAPSTVLREMAGNYWNLISNYFFISKSTRNQILDFVKSHPTITVPAYPHSVHVRMMHKAAIAEVGTNGYDDSHVDSSVPWEFEPPPARPLVLIIGLKFTQLAAVAASLLLVAMLIPALWRMVKDRELILMGLISLCVQLSLLICAVFDGAQARYVFPIWPGLWLVLIWSIWRFIRKRRLGGALTV